MTVQEVISSTRDIIERNAGTIISSRPIYVPDSAIHASNEILTTNDGQYLVKQSDPWYLAGRITGFFDGPGVTINASLYDRAIIPKELHFVFVTKEETVYVCHFDILQKHSYKTTQPDGEAVYVVSWRKSTRWQ